MKKTPPTTAPEVRCYGTIEFREIKDEPGTIGEIVGLAAVYDKRSEKLGGWFYEYVRKGAFTEHLATNPDVRCYFNHDRNVVLGRTKSGTLALRDTPKGLEYSCKLPDTTDGRNLATSIQRGDIDGSSFAFRVRNSEGKPGENWFEDDEDGEVRELLNLELHDVSPVSVPAYSDTTVGLRFQDVWEAHQEEVRKGKRTPIGLAQARQRQLSIGPNLGGVA